ncbi:MAG: hypothetical protein ACXAEN_21685 [Candidatus Thorarchaeota archaeon]
MKYPSIALTTGNSNPWCYSDYMWSMMHNVLTYPGRVSLFRMDHHGIDAIRNNRGVKYFLESDAEVMVRMDLDQWYPEDFLITMAPLALEYKVIGPEIYDRWEHHGYKILCFSDKYDPWNNWIDCSDATGIQSYPYTHTNNFYAREVVEAVPLPWFEAVMNEDGTDRGAHPDYDLLDRIRDAGYEIYLNHNIEVHHLFMGRAHNRLYNIYKKGIEHGY